MRRNNTLSLVALPLLCIGLAMVVALGKSRPAAAESTPLAALAPAASSAPKPAAAPLPVRVVIDFGDHSEKHFTKIDFTADMSAFDALRAAQSHPRGIRIQHSGNGETAFIKAIDDLANDRGPGEGHRFWQFSVNDKYAEVGCGSAKLKPGDTVRWFYTAYTPKP